MLPILRTITVGGVLLAFTIFVLALTPPDGSRTHLARIDASARGALIDRAAHPEWRQLLLLAAFRRAAELKELRELPDTPLRPPPAPVPAPAAQNKAAEQVAALPSGAHATNSAPDLPAGAPDAATIPVDIGEASSTELPVKPREEQPPVIMAPQPREISTPAQPVAPESPQPQAVRQDNPDKPSARASEPKPRESNIPAQPAASEPAPRHAMRQDKPDQPAAVTSKPQPVRATPKKRPHRASRHSTRTAKSAKTPDQPLPFDLLALLAASFKANAEHGPANSPATARK